MSEVLVAAKRAVDASGPSARFRNAERHNDIPASALGFKDAPDIAPAIKLFVELSAARTGLCVSSRVPLKIVCSKLLSVETNTLREEEAAIAADARKHVREWVRLWRVSTNAN